MKLKFTFLTAILIISIHATAQNRLQSADFISFNGHYGTVNQKLKDGSPVTVAFLGGSITNMTGWRAMVCEYLTHTYPKTKFKFINAGIPSLGSVPHSFRLQKDVLDQGRIDWLFIESAVNDKANGTPEVQQRRALEGIIRHMSRTNRKTDIVLMAFADQDKNGDFDRGEIPKEVKVHSELARYYHLPFINLALEVNKRIANKEFDWAADFKDLHPSPFGQEIYFNTIKTYIDENQLRPSGKLVPIPKTMDELAYVKGKYVDIRRAENLNTFDYIANWTPKDNVATRPGFVNIPVLESATKNSSFEFSFNGNAVGLGVLSGPDAGILSYRIDGGEKKTIDLFTRWSKSLHLPWYLVLADGLKKTEHRLKVSIEDDKNPDSSGNACRIAYFLVNEN